MEYLESRPEIETSPVVSAKKAALIYVSEDAPGYQRRPRGRGFCYLAPKGRFVKDKDLLARFKHLHIPPAWENVWISIESDCHIQATGRDERGRKQYIYHPRWNEIRNSAKFDRLVPFAKTLPKMRERVNRDLRREIFSRETVLAFVVSLLEHTLFRIGNEEYRRENHSFGLTTLLDRHLRVSGSVLHLKFRGKWGKIQKVDLCDRRLARLAKKYQELPGQELLKYQDSSGGLKVIESGDVNEYLGEITGEDFTAKDFRTWGGTVSAANELFRLGPAASEHEIKRNIVQAIRNTASRLGNTPAVCRKYYVAPQIIEAYVDGNLFKAMSKDAGENGGNRFNLDWEERAVVDLLKNSHL